MPPSTSQNQDSKSVEKDNDESRFLLLGQIAEQIKEAVRQGTQPDVNGFAAEHPELAEEIHGLAAMLDVMHVIAKEPHELSDSGETEEKPSQRLGDFEIIRKIGKGGMGVVYEARQLSLDRTVALKVLPSAEILDERQRKRFEKEARAAAALDHPHIAPVYEVGKEHGSPFYAMKLIEGRTLAEVIRKVKKRQEAPSDSSKPPTSCTQSCEDASMRPAGPLASSEKLDWSYFTAAARVIAQAAQALDHAHQRGVIHRDVKPSNIMLDMEGNAWVTDFGLAMLETGETLTGSREIVGTLQYMSPEQALGARGVDYHTDIYSLGATLYEMVALQPPFYGTRQEIFHALAHKTPTPLRRLNKSIPAPLEIITNKAMAKQPHDTITHRGDLFTLSSSGELLRNGAETGWRNVKHFEFDPQNRMILYESSGRLHRSREKWGDGEWDETDDDAVKWFTSPDGELYSLGGDQ